MHSSGLLGERVGHLLLTMLVIHNLKAALGTSVSLIVDQPQSVFGDVLIVHSAKYPLIAIVTCTGEQLQAHVNEEASMLYGNRSLEVQLEERDNKPNEYFVLPDTSGAALPEGDYQIDVLCSNRSTKKSATIMVSVVTPSTAAAFNHPYFIDSQRSVTVSASTPPGTVVTNFTAKVCATVRTQSATVAFSHSISNSSIHTELVSQCLYYNYQKHRRDITSWDACNYVYYSRMLHVTV